MPLIKYLLQFAVHQYGLTARPSKEKDVKVRYAQRELLGFTEEDIEMIERFVLRAIADGAL
ncbi:TPA: phage virion morphogenesis protein [Haemophilus influenzae]